MSSPRLIALALGLAATSLLVAAYSLVLSGSSSPPVAAAPTSNAEDELEAVRTRLAAVERRLATAERNLLLATRPHEGDDVVDRPNATPEFDNDDDDGHRAAIGTTPEFVEFEIAESGLDVRQHEDGSLTVRNSDPALANQVVTVKAQGRDGRVYELPITVPPAQ